MDYRDERDALRARVESLERQLEEARREAQARQDADPARVAEVQAHISEAEAQVHRIRGELSALGVARSNAPRRAQVGALVALVSLMAVGVTALVVMRTRAAQPAPEPSPTQVVQQVRAVAAAVSRAHAGTTAVDYFKDATTVPRAFQAKIGGPVRVLQLGLYGTYAIAEIQDPKNHENVDRYTLRDGVVSDGEAVRLRGELKTAKDVDAAVLDLATVDFSLVAKMIEETTAQLGIEDGKVSSAQLDATRVFQKEPRWGVYVSSPRKSGWVSFDTAGHVERVYK